MTYESPVMNIDQTAEYLNLSKCTVYDLVQRKDFPAIKLGKEWRIVTSELNLWLSKKCNEKLES